MNKEVNFGMFFEIAIRLGRAKTVIHEEELIHTLSHWGNSRATPLIAILHSL